MWIKQYLLLKAPNPLDWLKSPRLYRPQLINLGGWKICRNFTKNQASSLADK